jgi:hypothetical protein
MVLISISSPFLVLYCAKYKIPENRSGMLLFFCNMKNNSFHRGMGMEFKRKGVGAIAPSSCSPSLFPLFFTHRFFQRAERKFISESTPVHEEYQIRYVDIPVPVVICEDKAPWVAVLNATMLLYNPPLWATSPPISAELKAMTQFSTTPPQWNMPPPRYA